MIGDVMVGTNDLARATLFYDAVLKPLDLIRVEDNPDYVAYAPRATPDAIEFYVTRPFDQQPAHHGNGVMIAFAAQSRAIVDQFHEIGMWNGGVDEGAPGLRPPGGPVYYAYLRDPDGNKICGFNDRDTA